MDFFNFFKSLLGLPNSVPPSDFNTRIYDDNNTIERNDNMYRPGDVDEDDGMGFNIFTGPLEMHRYFEQQMNEIMRSFGIQQGSFFDGFFGNADMPIEEAPQPGNLREQYLKPGIETALSEVDKTDSDVDGKINMKDLDGVFAQKNVSDMPRKPMVQFFGQSMSSRTAVKPDGTVETTRTVKDNEGNETVTVTRKNGNKAYTVTTRTDKFGKQEREEQFVNIDDTDIDQFRMPHAGITQTPEFDIFFNKFFK